MRNANAARCLCDEIYGVTAANCDATTAYLCEYYKNLTSPTRFHIGKQPVDFDTSIQFASRMLRDATAPLISGIEFLGISNQQICVDLARAIGAQVISSQDNFGTIWRQGAVSATLAEVVEKSELVICISCDLAGLHPRINQRFVDNKNAVEYFSTGKGGQIDLVQRYVRTDTDELVDFLACVELLILDGQSPMEQMKFDPIRTRLFESASQFLQLLKTKNYVTFAIDTNQTESEAELIDQLTSLCQAGHRFAKCMVLDLSDRANQAGAKNVLAWSTGFPCGASFLEIENGAPVGLACTSNNEPAADAILNFVTPHSKATKISPKLPAVLITGGELKIAPSPNRLIIEQMSPFPDDFMRFDHAISEFKSGNSRESCCTAFQWLSKLKSQLLLKNAW